MVPSPLLVIGSGLLGASLGLQARRKGAEVQLEDASPAALALARDLGAGDIRTLESPEPVLVVVAVPPDVAASVVRKALDRFPHAIVTDVASVKTRVVEAVASHHDSRRYIGSHPMAGRERSGAIAADADLFAGRPWVITPSQDNAEETVDTMKQFALDMGALPILMAPQDHDRSVALVSHMPQLMSSLVAGALRKAPAESLALSGQGLRDVTRIAHSDSELWASIIAGNAEAVRNVLGPIHAALGDLIAALAPAESDTFAPGVLAGVTRVIARGNDGVSRIPGKHGGAPRRYADVIVLVPDRPGELGRLFTEVGDVGVNIEDLQLEHSVGQRVGRATLSVLPTEADTLAWSLEARGWDVIMEGKKHVGITIAVDGPSGSGKSTVSRRVAEELGIGYLDTGAMYRAAAWWCEHQGIDLDDHDAVATATRDMPLQMPLDPNKQTIVCGGVDITEAIRTPELSRVVSRVAVNLDVRAEMKRRQREIITHARNGIIAEGRDITTVVAPDADVRILLTASEETRLVRRAREVRGSTDAAALAQTRSEVVDRDRADATVSQFMTASDGVTTIDSSALSIDDVVATIIHLVKEKR
jgi:prephenate dehydrogenase